MRKPAFLMLLLCAILETLLLSSPPALAQTVEASERGTNAIQPPDKVMDAIGVKPGMVIGEVGPGRGRYTVHLAHRVGPSGRIYANDINADALRHLRDRCRRDEITNVEIIVGNVDDPLFRKGSLDMAFIILTYHHLSRPIELLKNLIPSLKPGATVVIVDPDPEKEKGRHSGESTSPGKMRSDAANAGFEIARIETFLPRDNIFVLRLKAF